jgi:hypothetical protein
VLIWIAPHQRCARWTCPLKSASVGSPTRGILAQSLDGNHDLIIVGSHGPQSRSVFGRDDLTLQVLTGADRPVLVIPSDDLS